jgi:membrane dipeptidase
MAKQGSVMGITGIRSFVRQSAQVTLNDALDHYSHVIRLAGIDHVGIGSDTALDARDQGRRQRVDIQGLNHPLRVYDLTEGLIRRGYSNSNIQLILGGNFKRVLSEIWNRELYLDHAPVSEDLPKAVAST